MISTNDVLTSCGKHADYPVRFPPTNEMLKDAAVTAVRVSKLLVSFGEIRHVTSGYRPAEMNARVKWAATHSNHITCRAADLEDDNGQLAKWCLANQDLLQHFELWMEDPRYTVGWVHLQTVAPHSGNRIFIPYAGAIKSNAD